MIVWLAPAALAGLLAAAGPVIVHLLRRQRARRLVVPTVRFVAGLDRSSVRSRLPSDVPLLLVRVAIVACASLALARPLLLHSGRTAAWGERTARVVIVDTSDSAQGLIDESAVSAEVSSANPALRIDTPDPGGALRRAAAWLEKSPPARREVVLLSDFQAGAVTEDRIAAVPGHIGVRLVSFGPAETARMEVAGVPVLTPEGVADVRIRLHDVGTAVTHTIGGREPDGLQILAPGNPGAAARLLRVVSTAGALAPSRLQPIALRFRGEPLAAPSPAPPLSWTLIAAQRLLRSRDIRVDTIRIADRSDQLLIDVDADAESLEAAQVLKAALDARIDPRVLTEHEPERIPSATLASWSREPAHPDAGAWRRSDDSDGRWIWLAALLLLGAETLLRRAPAAESRTTEAHAA